MTRPALRRQIDDYLAVRRSLGFALETDGVLLAGFARFADSVGHCGPVTTELAVAWALQTTSEHPAHGARRLAVVREFARHRTIFDPATEIPPEGILGGVGRPRTQPHIYSYDELAALLAAAGQLTPRGGLRPATYVALFGLLAATGLRLSEACRLGCGDVDLDEAVITVAETKFRKSRLVPLHPTAVEALAGYVGVRDARHGARSERFFRTGRSPQMLPNTVQRTFAGLRDRLGWTAEGRARCPRIHDLRHTFAVGRLLAWTAAGVDVDTKMLALSVYLGHAKPSDTYWYLSAVPELMAVTSRRFEDFTSREGRP